MKYWDVLLLQDNAKPCTTTQHKKLTNMKNFSPYSIIPQENFLYEISVTISRILKDFPSRMDFNASTITQKKIHKISIINCHDILPQ